MRTRPRNYWLMLTVAAGCAALAGRYQAGHADVGFAKPPTSGAPLEMSMAPTRWRGLLRADKAISNFSGPAFVGDATMSDLNGDRPLVGELVVLYLPGTEEGDPCTWSAPCTLAVSGAQAGTPIDDGRQFSLVGGDGGWFLQLVPGANYIWYADGVHGLQYDKFQLAAMALDCTAKRSCGNVADNKSMVECETVAGAYRTQCSQTTSGHTSFGVRCISWDKKGDIINDEIGWCSMPVDCKNHPGVPCYP